MPSSGQRSTYRYHVAECSTIKKMRGQNRFGRYVATTRQDGHFVVNHVDRQHGGTYQSGVEVELSICKNCLHTLDWDGYRGETKSKRIAIWKSFTPADFFDVYSNRLVTLPPISVGGSAGAVAPPAPSGSKPQQTPRPSPTEDSQGTSGDSEPPAPVSPWIVRAVEDRQYQMVLQHLETHNSLTMEELHRLAGGPRRARRFKNSYEAWTKNAPIRIMLTGTLGQQLYRAYRRT